MEWETVQAIIWFYTGAYAIFLLTVTLVVDDSSAKDIMVVGLCVVYIIGGLTLIYLKNHLREKQTSVSSNPTGT